MSLLPLGLLSQGGAAAASDFDLISQTVLTANQNGVTFSSIPATYRHLELRIVARSATAAVSDTMTVRLNGDTTSKYSWARTVGQSGATVYDQTYASTSGRLGSVAGNTATASIFGGSKILFTDVTATSKHLTGSSITGFVRESGSSLIAWSGFTRKVNESLTSVTIGLLSASDFLADSRFSLYGYRGT
jgi:hypothetical protein